MRHVIIINASLPRKREMQKWCDEIFGERGHWSLPMNSKPWYVRRSVSGSYEFSFLTEEDAIMFALKWL